VILKAIQEVLIDDLVRRDVKKRRLENASLIEDRRLKR
jgi:hypothetical protein